MFFSHNLLDWYKDNKRDLPWRRKGVTPYQVLVSEVMLQQTQVSRVVVKYHEFLSCFPTLRDLANATKADVIQSWSGLGYNRRALMLHAFAQEVVQKFDGIIPEDYDTLLALPGIGPYAAGSIASFAYNKPVPAIDVNVRRVFMRVFEGVDQGLPMKREGEKALYNLVKKNIPKNRSSDFHNALMDFASSMCTRKKPNCSECIMQKKCLFAPEIETKGESAFFVMEKREEKGITENGKFVPNRIFRGRILEYVRKNNGKKTRISELGKSVKKDYTKKEQEWLLGLCKALEKDGFVTHSFVPPNIVLLLVQE